MITTENIPDTTDNFVKTLTIDTEFKNLIPALLPEERAGLERSLLEEGCRDSIIVWITSVDPVKLAKDKRYGFCKGAGCKYETEYVPPDLWEPGDSVWRCPKCDYGIAPRIEEHIIIDGHNRYEICQKHGLPFGILVMEFDNRDDVIEWIYQNQLSRRNLTDEKRTYLIGKQYEHRKNRVGGVGSNQYKKVEGAQSEPLAPNAKTYDIIARENNVSRETVKRAEQYAKSVDNIAKTLGNETKEKILSGELKTNKQDIVKLSQLEPEKQAVVFKKVIEEKKDLKNVIKETERAERDEQLKSVVSIDETEEYNVILVDPPWQYDFSGTKNRDIENHYPTMTMDELKEMSLPAMEDSVMFMWATAPKLEEAIELLKVWGFAYKTCAVWDKEKIGMGYWFRGQHELLLVGVRGQVSPPAPENRLSSVIREKRTEHSKKPVCVYDMIEKMLPGGLYLEMFARNTRDGWGSWGNQI